MLCLVLSGIVAKCVACNELSPTGTRLGQKKKAEILGIKNFRLRDAGEWECGIASDIAAVNDSANEMSTASNQVKVSAEDLPHVAGTLQVMVAQFHI